MPRTPKQPFEKAIINATYNLYSISCGKLISVGPLLLLFFFSVARIANEPLFVIQELIDIAHRPYMRGKLTLWETAAWPRIATEGTDRDPGANREEMTTVERDIGDSIWQPPDYPPNSCDVSASVTQSGRLAASFIATGWRTSIPPSKTKRHRRLNDGRRTRENRRRPRWEREEERESVASNSEGKEDVAA